MKAKIINNQGAAVNAAHAQSRLKAYIPKNASKSEVQEALKHYYEVSFKVANGAIVGEGKLGEFHIKDYTGTDSSAVMPEFANRHECLSCFFMMPEGDMFYQTAEYIRIYGDDMSLKKLYLIKTT